MLQQELLSRTSLETQKLDLMDEVSYLKLKLVSMEEEHGHMDGDDKQHKAEQALQQELRLLKTKVDELESEKSQYERKLKATKAEISELQQLLASKDAEIESLQSQLLSRGNMSNDSLDRDLELQRMKIGMESLLAANDEKDRHIEELTALLAQYRKAKDMMVLSRAVCGDRLLCASSEEDLSGSLRLRPITHKAHSDIVRSDLQMSTPRGSSPLLLPPACLQNNLESNYRSLGISMENSMMYPSDTSFHNGQWSTPRMLSSSLEELQSGSKHRHAMMQPVEPVLETRHVSDGSKYRTLPGKFYRPDQNGDRDQYSSPLQLSPDESEDSVVNLRKTEKADESTLSDLSPLSSGVDSGHQSPVSPENKKNQKGIRKLWGKIRRTQSGSLPADSADLKRGGFRSTAGPRLACMSTADSARHANIPFSKWSCDQVCVWLEDYGLGQYTPMAKQWVSSGQTLLSASLHDLEKELGMKHPLHRKKLQLALHSFSTKLGEKSADLDYVWVTRWLDDIGLPQYKDQFHEGRVDGRMLQYLTVNDLLILKVSSQLHHLSIKSAIHVLHVNKFNPNCLKRRPGDEAHIQSTPSEVMQWSNHRVMEWLRSVDLAEYAPNLRGSGVHGGLIILEPRFNSDTLAMLLNIPPQKTLLRRHLATNFASLVGAQAQQEKQEYVESAGYTPLSTTAKVRPKKLGFSNFGHLRKKRPDDSTDYICPLEAAQAQALLNGAQRPYTGFRGLSPILDRDPEKREQVGPPHG